MTEQFFTRDGIKCVHVAPAGSRMMMLSNDGRVLVTHPEHPAYVVNPDGTTQVCVPGHVIYCDIEYWRLQ